MEIFREFTFDCGHHLNHLPEGHKCARPHGHTYKLVVHLEGDLDPTLGWVMDFADVKVAVHQVIDQLDHRYLNDIDGLEQPTAERIAIWIWDRLKPQLPALVQVTLWENQSSGCTYRG